MKIGIIAGNRSLPLLLAQNIKNQSPDSSLSAICFRGETSPRMNTIADKTYWIDVGNLEQLRKILKKENFRDWIMAGQISPLRIFNTKRWDRELIALVDSAEDMRPHEIFLTLINHLQKEGIRFLDSTQFLTSSLAESGVMNELSVTSEFKKNLDFGVKVISRYVEMDVGQTIIVKKRSVVALESLEGTDKTILRGYRFAGKGCMIFKFSKQKQDFRFDVPIVGLKTLKLLRRIHAQGLVLEEKKVIILNKEKFLSLAREWNIPVIGAQKVADYKETF